MRNKVFAVARAEIKTASSLKETLLAASSLLPGVEAMDAENATRES
jgi:hypothetical protein